MPSTKNLLWMVAVVAGGLFLYERYKKTGHAL